MDAKLKHNLLLVVTGVLLFAALMNLPAIIGFANQVISLILPVIAGGILALFIHVPMNAIKRGLVRLFAKRKKQLSDKMIHILAFVLTVIAVLLVLTLVLTLLIPEIAQSSQNLYAQIQERIAYIEGLEFDEQWLEDLTSKLDLEGTVQKIYDEMSTFLPGIVGVFSSTVSMITTAGFALIISIYMTLSKERLCRHARRAVCAFIKPAWARAILRFCRAFTKSFANFLSAQGGEAVILGTLMFLAFTIFRLPYASIVGVITAVCAIIPYIGAILSCTISVLLTLLIAPELAVRALIVYLVVQFIENQFLYPRVVGGSVGLPPLYILIATTVGGKLFGILGIIFFIPLAAVILDFAKAGAARRLEDSERAAVLKMDSL